MAPLIEQEILYRLLRGPTGPRLLQIAMAETPSNRIAGAIAWLKGNFTRPLRIEELAEHSTFIEVAHLIILGQLPNSAQLRRFSDLLTPDRMRLDPPIPANT